MARITEETQRNDGSHIYAPPGEKRDPPRTREKGDSEPPGELGRCPKAPSTQFPDM